MYLMSRRDLWGIKYKRLIEEGEGLLLYKILRNVLII